MDTIIYTIASTIATYVGTWTAINIIALFAISLLLLEMFTRNLSLTSIILALATYPLLTPAVANLLGYQLFSGGNIDLQRDRILVTAAMLLIFIFCLSFYIGARINSVNFPLPSGRVASMSVSQIVVSGLISTTLIFLFAEPAFIVDAKYSVIKENPSAYAGVSMSIFYLVMSVMLMCSTHGRKLLIIKIFLVFALMLSVLMSRRKLTIGIITILLMLRNDDRVTVKQYIMAAIGVFLLVAIGDVRTVGLLNYIDGARVNHADAVYRMDGGGSIIFVVTMGVIHLIGSGILIFPETMPILLWFAESSTYSSWIYESYGYYYIGGMHIAANLYWNFGIIGVSAGGVCFGWAVNTMLNRFKAHGIGSHYKSDAILFFIAFVSPSIILYGLPSAARNMMVLLIFLLIVNLVPVRRRV